MRNNENKTFLLSIIILWPDMEEGKVGLGEKEWFFRKKDKN